MFYFDNESEISLKGIISFASIPVESAHRLVRLSTKECEADNGWFEVVTRKRAWALRSGFKTKDDALAWVRRIREGIRASLGSAVRSPLSHSSALMRSTTSPLLPGFAKPTATSSCDLKTEGSKRIGKIGKSKLTKMESLAQVFKKKKLKKVKSLTSLKLPKAREIGSSSDTRSGIVETSASFEEAPLRLVFLGMSGSGKSTLCLQMRIRDALLRSTFLSESIGSLVDCMGQSDKHAFDKTMGAIMPSFVADSDSAIATHSTEEYSLSLSEDEEVVAKSRTRGDCLEVDALADLTQSERQIIRDGLLSKTELHKLKKAISVGLLQDMHQLIQECLYAEDRRRTMLRASASPLYSATDTGDVIPRQSTMELAPPSAVSGTSEVLSFEIPTRFEDTFQSVLLASWVSPLKVADEMRVLWNDCAPIKRMFGSRAQFSGLSSVSDSFAYFMKKLEEMKADSWMPSLTDALRWHCVTSAARLHEATRLLQESELKAAEEFVAVSKKGSRIAKESVRRIVLCDIGGSKTAQKKWSNLALSPECHCVVWCFSLDAFDKALSPDSDENLMDSALSLYASAFGESATISLPMEVPILLCLTHTDLAKKRLQRKLNAIQAEDDSIEFRSCRALRGSRASVADLSSHTRRGTDSQLRGVFEQFVQFVKNELRAVTSAERKPYVKFVSANCLDAVDCLCVLRNAVALTCFK